MTRNVLLLGASYYSPPLSAIFKFGGGEVFQRAVRFHEFAHIFTGLGDSALAGKLKGAGAHISDEDIAQGASAAIAIWQSKGCPYSVTTRTSGR